MVTNQLRFVSQLLCQLWKLCSSGIFNRNQGMTNTCGKDLCKGKWPEEFRSATNIFKRTRSEAVHISNTFSPVECNYGFSVERSKVFLKTISGQNIWHIGDIYRECILFESNYLTPASCFLPDKQNQAGFKLIINILYN